MPTPLHSIRGGLVAALLLLAAACGGASDPVAAAQGHLARGQLEAATGVLAGVQGPAAEALRAEISSRRQLRQSVEAQAEALVERAGELSLPELQQAFRDLAGDRSDPVVRQLCDRYLSRAVDRRAELATSSRSDRRAPSMTRLLEGPGAGQTPSDGEALAGGPTGAELQPAETSPFDPSPVAQLLAPQDREAPAELHEQAGRLGEAAAAWRGAAAGLTGTAREELLARAADCAERHALRVELARAFESDPDHSAWSGYEYVGPDGLERAAGRRVWSELSLGELDRLAAAASLSSEARLGLVRERLRRDAEDSAWRELNRLWSRGQVDAIQVRTLVAFELEERPPETGYVFWEGRFLRPERVAELELEQRLVEAAEDLVDAGPEERDELFDWLLEHGRFAALEQALDERWSGLTRSLSRGSALDGFERIAAARRELDLRREQALALIFDEGEYFYPFQGPEVPPDKAALYPAVQQRVDGLVAAVREVWSDASGPRIPDKLREQVAQLRWNLERADQLDHSLELPEGLPAWILALPAWTDELNLESFAWTEAEARDLAYSAAVEARNEELWQAAPPVEWEGGPSSDEQEQVRITNAYRRMLGRRSLAWNPRIQLAADDHSAYMAATGDFGHFEIHAETRSPFDRMRRRGYSQGVSENASLSGGDPASPHYGWCHSAGHHRNLLQADHREMASAVDGRYWTQNFGVDTRFQEDLTPWQD